MRRPLKLAIWTLVFLACAGAGAFVASRTDPFPPGVEDPGARSTATPSSSVTPPPPSTVRVVVEAATRHELHVGGTCTSDWIIRLDLVVSSDASARGTGIARLRRGASCAFETAQVQARAVHVSAKGHVEEGTLLFAMSEEGERVPAGSVDLGGLVQTLSRVRFSVPLEGPPDNASVERPDGDLGRYLGVYQASGGCVESC